MLTIGMGSTPAAAPEFSKTHWNDVALDSEHSRFGPALLAADGNSQDGRHVAVTFATLDSGNRAVVNGTYKYARDVLQIAQSYERRDGRILVEAVYSHRAVQLRVELIIEEDTGNSRISYSFPSGEVVEVLVRAGEVSDRLALPALRREAARSGDLLRMIHRYLDDLRDLPKSSSRPGDALLEVVDPMPDRCYSECATECGQYNCGNCDPYDSVICAACWATCGLGCHFGCD